MIQSSHYGKDLDLFYNTCVLAVKIKFLALLPRSRFGDSDFSPVSMAKPFLFFLFSFSFSFFDLTFLGVLCFYVGCFLIYAKEPLFWSSHLI